ncbi:hypothetical protein [Bradyrhizobium australiense]|uniref:Uncharacterized protein n=1 Tax=Bradyrhizobium australiense TaxID=2721161 RepID=A0A7Y4GSQ2_9BRAD|nr:hypothetical protein [Bradyrhizobium australiense]NOJ41047.1 hypothetical protein [Bradyrhizobium australiense]
MLFRIAVFAACLCVSIATAVASEGQTVACTINGRSVSAADCLAALTKQMGSTPPSAAAGPKPTTVWAHAAPKDSTPSPAVTLKPKPLEKAYNTWHWDNTLLVRNSMDDLGSFKSPSSLKKATGAEFSWARDGIAHNDVWTARGLVAERLFGWEEPSLLPYVTHALIAPYAVFDRVANTNPAKATNNVDDLTGGLAAEVALANFLQATHYFRFLAEEDGDFAGRAKNWKVGLEYQPFGNPNPEQENSIFAYLGTPLPLGPYWFLTISPKLRVEYRESQDGAVDPIFFLHNQVLRAGPSVTVAISGNSIFSDVPWYIQRTHFRATYGTLYDFYSSRNYGLLDTALTYDLDPNGYLGLTLSYRKGKLETTGANVDLVKVSLSAKFGQ